MTLQKKVLVALLPLALGISLVALAQSTNGSAPEGTTIVQKHDAGPTVGQPGQTNRDLNIPQNVGASAPVQVAQTQTPIQDNPPATTPSPAPSPVTGSNMDTNSSQSSSATTPPATTSEKSESSSYATSAGSDANASATSTQKLPKTASDVPLAALAGVLALGAGLGLRALRR